MEIIGKILGSNSRIRIMRLFLLNKCKVFTLKEIIDRTRVNPEISRKEIKLLNSVQFIKKRSNGFYFNNLFKYTKEFEGLLVGADTLDHSYILEHFKKVGKLKLLLISGVFIKNKDSRVDILVIGDNLKKSKVEEVVKKLEAEIGIEMVYAVFNTNEFIYRLNMYDKLIRDILDFPHQIVFQSKELSTQALKKS